MHEVIRIDLVPRGIQDRIERAWRSSPVVVLEGPRGAGKTTLARQIAPHQQVHDLADPTEFLVASQSPTAWVEAMPPGSVIDEAQRIPGLSLVVKRHVDRPGAPAGQLLLTGSVRLSRDELGGSDPLVGRVRRLQCTHSRKARSTGPRGTRSPSSSMAIRGSGACSRRTKPRCFGG